MKKLDSQALMRQLRAHPRAKAVDLCTQLGGINQSTLSRALQKLGDQVIARGGSRRVRYALRRELRGQTVALPLYRIDAQGRGAQIGMLDCIAPEGTALTLQQPLDWPLPDAMRDGWFDGVPYPLLDMRPQGFLGRDFARRCAGTLGVPENPEQWSDDDILHVLSVVGSDLPGDLILGEEAYRRFLLEKSTPSRHAITPAQIAQHYPQRAAEALTAGHAGSSAAGEFPKFLASRLIDGQPVEMLVKFSGAEKSAAVQRWSDLLVCEHLALQTVQARLGITAAHSEIHQAAGRTFLEVIRFDRHGAFGRSGVCSLQSINGGLLGMASTAWNKAALKLQQAGWLSAQDARAIEVLWWFGRLIGNTDMHDGNLAFRPGLKLAPVYDMLPMLYAPARGGEIPARSFAPALPLPAEAPAWEHAAHAAQTYWQECASDVRISTTFRKICRDNGVKVMALLEQM